MDHDYERLDFVREFKYTAELYQKANKAGYDFISEFIIKTYRKTRSSIKTAKVCGKTSTTILNFLHWAKEPVRARGGYHKQH